jgi:hypothetical protein
LLNSVYLFINTFNPLITPGVGTTEQIENDLNPSFKKTFTAEYYFEQQQYIKVELYDIDGDEKDLSGHDFLGFATVNLASIVSAPGCTVQEKLLDKNLTPMAGKNKRLASLVIIHAEETSLNSEHVKFTLKGVKFPKMDFFGTCDPFIQILKLPAANNPNALLTEPTKLYESEVIKDTYTPVFKPFTLPVVSICNGDYDRPFLLRAFDWDGKEDFEYIGEAQTTLRELRHVCIYSCVCVCIHCVSVCV